MKTKTIYLFALSFLLIFSANQTKAQQLLIHYWDFNTLVGDSVGNVTVPVPASYTTLSSTNPKMVYTRPYSLNMYYDSIVSIAATGSSYFDYSSNNYTYFSTSDSALGNEFIKVRNPSANAFLLFYIPTTGYKNITFNYAMSVSSSKGPNTAFSYSTNGGHSWNLLVSGMDTFNTEGRMHPDTLQNVDSVTVGGTGWVPVSISFGGDPTTNNCSGFILKMTSAAGLDEGGALNDTLHSGNLRLDNFAVMGDSLVSGIDNLTLDAAGYNVYPNPVNNVVTITSDTYVGNKIITLYNVVGQSISVSESTEKQTAINTSALTSGVYFVEIKEVGTGNKYTAKIVKE
jgi:hypothetical protein